jgi:hypothetical protein
MVCESCKASIPDAARFCPQCGSKIEKAESLKIEESIPPVQETAEAVAAVEAAKPVVPQTAGKQKAGNPVLWILAILILLAAGAAGGYFIYKTFLQKNEPQFASQPVRGLPDQSQYQGAAGGQNQQGMQQPLQPGQQQPPLTPPTTVEITASAIVADIVNGLPTGFTTEYKVGGSRVVHYVKYQKALPGQTNISSQFYRDGKLIFKCGPNVVQYKAGNYFCRPNKDFDAGAYEVRFFVDGVERQPLGFTVMN